MNGEEIKLAWSLIQYLRSTSRDRAVHKFNVIGKSGQGDFERWRHEQLRQGEKEALIWIWDELKRLRLIVATGTDLVEPENWVRISDEGNTVSEPELVDILSDGSSTKIEGKRLDGLTGIPDRTELDKDLAVLPQRANAANPLSLIMMDLDYFKSINDDFGHPAGDDVLREAGSAVNKISEGKGHAYRYGGEEIAVLLPNHSLQESAAVAERIRSTIEALKISAVDRVVTASFGVSTYPAVSSTPELLLSDADDALYLSKERGRNRVTCAEKVNDATPARKSKRQRIEREWTDDIRVRLAFTSRQNYLIQVENRTEQAVTVEQISLEQEQIALMDPVRLKAGDNWKVEAGRTLPISWRPEPNPADSLMRIHSNEGVQFSTFVEFALRVNSDGIQHHHRQKMAVYVSGASGQLKQLAG